MENPHESAAVAEAVVPLTFPFTRSGYRHVLLARGERWCVVERTWIEDGCPHLPYYEIVQLRVRVATFWRGRLTPAHEAYPPVAAWGREGWSEPTLIHAHRRWARLRATRQDLPSWDTFGLVEDREAFRAWKEGRPPRGEASAPTLGILADTTPASSCPFIDDVQPEVPPA